MVLPIFPLHNFFKSTLSTLNVTLSFQIFFSCIFVCIFFTVVFRHVACTVTEQNKTLDYKF